MPWKRELITLAGLLSCSFVRNTQDNIEEIVQILIDHKINVNANSIKDGLTAIDILRRRGFSDDSSLVQLLLANVRQSSPIWIVKHPEYDQLFLNVQLRVVVNISPMPRLNMQIVSYPFWG